MDIRISLTDSEADQLGELARDWRVSLEEAAKCAMRTHFSADQEPVRNFETDLTFADAMKIVLHAVWNKEGTYVLLTIGIDPGSERMKQLSMALTELWKHLRKRDSIAIPISQAAGTILNRRNIAEENTSGLRDSLLTELTTIFHRAYCVLAGAAADVEF